MVSSVARILAVVLLLLGLCPPKQVWAADVRVGYFYFPPHVYEKDGLALGAAPDLFDKVAREMGLGTWEYVNLPISRLIHKLENNKIEFGLYFAKSAEREQKFVYPTQSFVTIPLALAVMKDHELPEIQTIRDLKGMRIGYLQDAYLPESLRSGELDFEFLHGQDWTSINLKKVVQNRIDAAMSSYYQLQHELKQGDVATHLKLLKVPDTDVEIYTVMSPAAAQIYRKKYEQALQKVLSRISYDDLFARHE